jgi:hypothetical protein
MLSEANLFSIKFYNAALYDNFFHSAVFTSEKEKEKMKVGEMLSKIRELLLSDMFFGTVWSPL